MKKIIAIICAVIIFSFTVYADTAENVDAVSASSSNLATEYYSSDLFSEPTDFAATVPMNSVPEIKAKSFVLMEASTGEVLYENSYMDVSPYSQLYYVVF